MHPLLIQALEPVLRDIAGTGAPMPVVADSPAWAPPDSPPFAYAMLSAGGASAGVGIDTSETVVDRVVKAADDVQDWLIHELGLHRLQPTNWPVCPTHPTSHPLTPINRNGHAMWVCPTDAREIAPIGNLARHRELNRPSLS